MTDKTVNYTPEQTAQLVAKYNDGVSVESLAEMFGKTTRSIVAKLSREGVYHAKSKSTGVARVKKAELVDRIANRVGVAPETFDSLEKANHEVLEAILANLRWLRWLRVRKFTLDPQPQFMYNNILDSREGLNEYQRKLVSVCKWISPQPRKLILVCFVSSLIATSV